MAESNLPPIEQDHTRTQYYNPTQQGKEIDIDLIFLNNATYGYDIDKRQNETKIQFIQQSFIMIRRCVQVDTSKAYRLQTDLLIYKLSNLEKPVLEIKQMYFESLYNGFFIREKDDSKVKFVLFGEEVVYVIDHDLNEDTFVDQDQIKEFKVWRQRPRTAYMHKKVEVSFC